VNWIGESFSFTEPCPRDIGMILVELGSNFLSDSSLSFRTKLFLAELSSICHPHKCGHFLRDLNCAAFHPPPIFLRIAYVTLEEGIQRNEDSVILKDQFQNCRMNLLGPVLLPHCGMTIDLALLKVTRQQIRILEMISTGSSRIEKAEQFFEKPERFRFLSLPNLTKLFIQFVDVAEVIFPFLLPLFVDLIWHNPREIDPQARIFEVIQFPLSDKNLYELLQIQKILDEVEACSELLFAAALAYARASVGSDQQTVKLVELHEQLGKKCICHLQNGVFLEYLLEGLILRVDEFESKLTKAFSYYYSELVICSAIL
jgi:hypothetical protein